MRGNIDRHGSAITLEAAEQIMDNVAAVYDIGRNTTYVLQTDGSLWTWGRYQFNPHINYNYYPEKIADSVARVFSDAFSSDEEIYIQTKDGYVYHLRHRWGRDALLEHPVFTRVLPVPVLDVIWVGRYDTIFFDGAISFYIDSENNLIQRHYYQRQLSEQVIISSNAERVFRLNFGNVLFHDTSGNLWGMGPNEDGELGDGTYDLRNEPVLIAEGVIFARSRAFIKQDGTFWAWSVSDPTPQKVLENVVSVVGNHIHFNDGRFLANFFGNRDEMEFVNVMIPRERIFQ